MGFYPKHFKQRRHMVRMRLIASAALAGCMFKPDQFRERTGAYNYNGDDMFRTVRVWSVVYPDGAVSRAFRRKSEAAGTYLLWFLEYKLGLKGRR